MTRMPAGRWNTQRAMLYGAIVGIVVGGVGGAFWFGIIAVIRNRLVRRV
jgi:hypothetical protein